MSDASTLRTIAQGLGIVWASPNTVLGLIAGSIGIAFGAHAHLRPRDLAIVFHRWPWGPGGALTLGNTILHTGDSLDSDCVTYAHRAGHLQESSIRLADHERAHVYQYMALGPLFLPLYLLCGGVTVRNRFERAADRYAQTGRGWWPWPSGEPTNGRPVDPAVTQPGVGFGRRRSNSEPDASINKDK